MLYLLYDAAARPEALMVMLITKSCLLLAKVQFQYSRYIEVCPCDSDDVWAMITSLIVSRFGCKKKKRLQNAV